MPRQSAAEPILAAAGQCLVEGGGDFEMIDVARTANVSEGLAYHYYKSKNGLLGAIVARFFERYHAVANARHDGTIPWPQREKARLDAIIAFLYSDPLAPIIFGQMSRTPHVAAAERSGQSELIRLSARNIGDGIRRGFIPDSVDPAIAAAAIMGAVREVFIQAMQQDPRPDAGWLAGKMWAFIAAAVELKPG